MSIKREELFLGKKTQAILPEDVYRDIGYYATGCDGRLRFKKISYREEPVGYRVYHGEGRTYGYFYPTAAGYGARSVEMGADYNVGAAAVSDKIGAEVAPPAGTYVIETGLFLGKWFLNLTKIVDPARILAG